MKPTSVVIKSDQGQAFWQPGIKGNCITIKVSPWNIADTSHTIFLHELPKNGYIPEHAHDINLEIFICLEGEAIFTINGAEHQIKQHDVIYVSPQDKHSIRSVSDATLKIMVIVTPCGLEERLKLMGKVKSNPGENPPESFSSDFAENKSHGLI